MPGLVQHHRDEQGEQEDEPAEHLALCPRYSALVFENVAVRPSPAWLAYRLTSVGLNPISNIVDMTNFVMAELAQPMHAFDADKLRGGILVRPARSGERFHALNGEWYTLDPANLVIADSGGAIALAGVIGGMETAIGPTTTRVVLESANFQASSIRKTSAAIKLRTDASIRFEKAQDPANTVRGIARAIAILHEIAPGIRTLGGVADPPPRPAAAPAHPPAARMAGTQTGPHYRARRGPPHPREPVLRGGRTAARRLPGDRALPGAPPRTSRSKTTWWRRSAEWWATTPSPPARPW